MENLNIQPHQIEQREVTKFEARKKEILEVFEVMKKVNEFISQAVEESRRHGNDFDEFLKIKFIELVELLSLESCFDKKFSTSSSFKDGDVPEYKLESDSIYFVTRGGITIRLKAKNLKYGIQDVVQPVTEKIFFKRGDKIFYAPAVADDVYEARCSSFGKVILSGNVDDYFPTLEIEEDDVNSLRRFEFHSGHKINCIFK